MKRSPMKRNPPKVIPPRFRREVLTRSQGLCEVKLKPCTAMAQHIHHIKRRSQGGPDLPENLLHVCSPCHRWIHDHPGEAYELGLLVRSGNGR